MRAIKVELKRDTDPVTSLRRSVTSYRSLSPPKIIGRVQRALTTSLPWSSAIPSLSGLQTGWSSSKTRRTGQHILARRRRKRRARAKKNNKVSMRRYVAQHNRGSLCYFADLYLGICTKIWPKSRETGPPCCRARPNPSSCSSRRSYPRRRTSACGGCRRWSSWRRENYPCQESCQEIYEADSESSAGAYYCR